MVGCRQVQEALIFRWQRTTRQEDASAAGCRRQPKETLLAGRGSLDSERRCSLAEVHWTVRDLLRWLQLLDGGGAAR